MSLYNDIANQVSRRGLANLSKDGVNAFSDNLAKGAATAMGGGALAQAATTIGSSMAKNAASSVINKYIPPGMSKMIGSGVGVLSDVASGDFQGAGLKLLDSGLLNDYLPGMGGVVAQQRYFNSPTPLFGGITPKEAQKIYTEMQSIPFAKKNLFLIEVSSQISYDAPTSARFNLFVTDIDYSPLTITGEKKKIGGAHADITNSSDPVELRITTLDDKFGDVKNWFAAHCATNASQDGTVGLPYSYAIQIKIVHGFVTGDSTPPNHYEDKGLFRPANMELSLSRREDGLQELQLSFVQLDTFMKA